MNGEPSQPPEEAELLAPSDDLRPRTDDATERLPPKVDPETLVLRGKPTRAIRFKRGAIASLMGAAAVSVVAIAWFALEPHAIHLVASGDDQLTLAKTPSDTLSGLPSSYGNVPKLGPPLPGDLGRPILDRQQQLAGGIIQPTPSYVPPSRVPTADEARQRRLAERKAARESGLLVSSTGHDGGATSFPAVALATPAPVAPGDKLAIDPDRDPNGQQRKADFLRANDSKGDINPHFLSLQPSPYTLSAGTIIAASLITGLRSDLPGLVTAQVTERVFDSATGRILLIPQGARLLGSYDSVVTYGQRRALVVWQRLIYPDGSSIALDNAPASDASGYAGLSDKVDSHGWALLKGVVLSTLLGVGTELRFGGQGGLVEAVRQSGQQNVARAGDQLTSHALQVQPTLTVRPGAPVRLLFHQDLVLKPWREEG